MRTPLAMSNERLVALTALGANARVAPPRRQEDSRCAGEHCLHGRPWRCFSPWSPGQRKGADPLVVSASTVAVCTRRLQRAPPDPSQRGVLSGSGRSFFSQAPRRASPPRGSFRSSRAEATGPTFQAKAKTSRGGTGASAAPRSAPARRHRARSPRRAPARPEAATRSRGPSQAPPSRPPTPCYSPPSNALSRQRNRRSSRGFSASSSASRPPSGNAS